MAATTSTEATPTGGGPAAWRLGHRPTLDGLRGVAIALVLALHWWPADVPGGDTGVDLFFVLSGFLITRLLIEEHHRHGRIDVAAFYTRRARRLFPALAVLVAVGAASSGVLWVLLYAANVGRMNGALLGGPLEHTWSLAIEEQFYLVWPAAMVLLLRARRPALFIALGVVLVALHRVQLDADWLRLTAGTDTRADALLLGALVAFTVGRLATYRWAAPAAAVAPLLFLVVVQAPDLTRWGYTLVAGLWAIVLLWALQAPGSWLAAGPLRTLGRLSYSLYLWHYPVTWALRDGNMHNTSAGTTAAAIVLSAAAAAVSYHLVECRFRQAVTR